MDAWLDSLNTLIENPSENYRAVGAAIAIVVVLITIIVLILIALALPARGTASASAASKATAAPKKQRTRRARWTARLIGFGVFILTITVGLTVSAFAWYRTTSTSDYCGRSCHEMSDASASWAISSHKHVPCVRCHEGQERSDIPKNISLRIGCLYYHAARSQGPQRPVPVDRCLSCHIGLLDTELTASNGESFTHRTDAPESLYDCESCHEKPGHSKL